ncbi:MAG: hypothetical protein IMZ61_04680 [Planctomycetes bacterium]|nr:hypothetical protein [Planctomycetota bacterium]
MILQEATIGGTVYLEYDDEQMKLPEAERVAFKYRVLTNKEKIDLIHKTQGVSGRPNGGDVCLTACTQVDNLMRSDGTALDTVIKMMAYPDVHNRIAYMLTIVGAAIWYRQTGEEAGLKN